MRNERRRSSIAGRAGRPATGKGQDPGNSEKSVQKASKQSSTGTREGGEATRKEQRAAPKRIKVISIGDAKTGKTCIIKRRCEGRFVSKYLPTIGIDYGVKAEQVRVADGKDLDVRVNFFDFSGDPDYLDVRNEFYQDVSGAFLVFDCTDRTTFCRLSKWLEEMKEYGADPACVPIVLCSNKVDKASRQVKESDGLAFASANGLTYFETSAQSGEGISAMFETLLQMIAKKPPVSGWK